VNKGNTVTRIKGGQQRLAATSAVLARVSNVCSQKKTTFGNESAYAISKQRLSSV